jgi:kinesin family protein 4/21/27
MRLTNELRSSKPGDADALAKFNETVEPVILEYEKVVAALNKQLDDLRMEIVRRFLSLTQSMDPALTSLRE